MFEARTPVVAIAVGVGVTVLSAIVPARRAVRIPPVAALVEHSEDETQSLRRWRVAAGACALVAGIVATIAGVVEASTPLVGLGAVARVPRYRHARAGPGPAAVERLGRPLAALLGTPGRLGRENSMRSPRRTAQTAAALMVGLALVSTIAVLGARLAASAKSSVDSALNADYIIGGLGLGSAHPCPGDRLPPARA